MVSILQIIFLSVHTQMRGKRKIDTQQNQK